MYPTRVVHQQSFCRRNIIWIAIFVSCSLSVLAVVLVATLYDWPVADAKDDDELFSTYRHTDDTVDASSQCADAAASNERQKRFVRRQTARDPVRVDDATRVHQVAVVTATINEDIPPQHFCGRHACFETQCQETLRATRCSRQRFRPRRPARCI